MKKKLYQNPEMEIIKLNQKSTLLETSGESAGGSGSYCPTEGSGDPNE